ncbi:MAG: hypothetical protein ACYTEV_13675, partial [Planctomycetota bacterium]
MRVPPDRDAVFRGDLAADLLPEDELAADLPAAARVVFFVVDDRVDLVVDRVPDPDPDFAFDFDADAAFVLAPEVVFFVFFFEFAAVPEPDFDPDFPADFAAEAPVLRRLPVEDARALG